MLCNMYDDFQILMRKLVQLVMYFCQSKYVQIIIFFLKTKLFNTHFLIWVEPKISAENAYIKFFFIRSNFPAKQKRRIITILPSSRENQNRNPEIQKAILDWDHRRSISATYHRRHQPIRRLPVTSTWTTRQLLSSLHSYVI